MFHSPLSACYMTSFVSLMNYFVSGILRTVMNIYKLIISILMLSSIHYWPPVFTSDILLKNIGIHSSLSLIVNQPYFLILRIIFQGFIYLVSSPQRYLISPLSLYIVVQSCHVLYRRNQRLMVLYNCIRGICCLQNSLIIYPTVWEPWLMFVYSVILLIVFWYPSVC